jgi:DUF1009 family protein
MKKVGLVAGRDRLPFDVLTEMDQRDVEPVIVGLQGEVNPELKGRVGRYLYREIPVGHIGDIIQFFKDFQVEQVVFAGKVGKEAIFIGGLDEVAQRLINGLTQRNDDAILLAIVEEFERNEITVAKQTDFLQSLLAPSGVITGDLTKIELSDVKLGFRMAKASGRLDIGQSVVVKQGVVLAVEAIEGTDQAILRGGTLGGPGTVVVKVSKPQQDERFDVPTVGKSTLESMIRSRAAVLAIEAGKTFITEAEEFVRLAMENGIKILATSGEDINFM